MGEVKRKFILDRSKVYFVSGGVVLSEDITEVMKNYRNGVSDLIRTGDNVGWASKDTYLMVTEDNKIYRIDSDLYIQMLKDTDVIKLTGLERHVITLQYEYERYPDEFLKASLSYKLEPPIQCGDQFLARIYDVPDRGSIRRRGISFDKNMIYSIVAGDLLITHVKEYMKIHGERWRDVLEKTDDSVGYILSSRTALLISRDKMQRIDYDRARELINDPSTGTVTADTAVSDLYEEVYYNFSKFSDEYLGATTDYKDCISIPRTTEEVLNDETDS